ncbi:hypothetical protein [Nostoc sp. TCL26-01]|uniref:hypothetical protein n=1 Tax=Nostoc sp. TCL26-01 TaxID=2576904 RepID=UPI0015BCFA87|nr:hypothetical protein [Nostoc sp. TCL26-01]QLE60002.1 hypothetical protein FD725_31840 [Nostoc sp. TCL26-01]
MDSKQAAKNIIESLKYLKHDSPESNEVINWLYTPDIQLSDYLDEIKYYLQKEKPTDSERQQAGYLLEGILTLSFKGLVGYSEIKSYQSASHQYDFLISGDGADWDIICNRLFLKDYRGIVAEAKATEEVVSVAQFSRLCSIMTLELFNTVGLGVFFTLKGAAGFPNTSSRQRCVSYARLCQLLFYARHNKKIVVFDKDDIFELNQNGALIKILIRKIKEIEQLSGLKTAPVTEPIDVDLPERLKKLIL